MTPNANTPPKEEEENAGEFLQLIPGGSFYLNRSTIAESGA